MNTKRPLLPALRWCGSCVLLLGCWAVWIALAVLLVTQVWVATHRELTVPAFALRSLERRLADSQITARFGRALFDPKGHVMIEQVQLFSPPHAHPIITIRAAYARVDLAALLIGRLRLRELRLTGVDLFVPAMLSPSGTDDAVVSDLDGVFRLGRSTYDVALCTFRLDGIPITATGRIDLPPRARPSASATPMLDLIMRRYLAGGRRLAALRPVLDQREGVRIDLRFTPADEQGATVRAELFADSFHGLGPLRTTRARALAVFPLLGSAAEPVRLQVAADAVAWEGRAAARQVSVDLTGSLIPDRFVLAPNAARLVASGGEAMGVRFEAPSLEADLAHFPRVQGDLRIRAAGSDLALTGEADLGSRQGAVAVDGAIAPPVLAIAHQLGVATAGRVRLGAPALVHARAAFDPGWKPARAEGDVAVRHAVAQEVTIDAASGHVVYAGGRVDVTDLHLLAGGNEARGSYTMKVATREFRFLLTGRLRPHDIAPWFKESWTRFWEHFDFAAAAPAADVDIAGRWRDYTRTRVFCFADAERPGIRGVAFDHVRATLFVRPYFYQVLAFEAQQAGRSARGSFTLAYDRARMTYRSLDFDVDSGLALDEWARLYGPRGASLVAPYRLAAPPDVRATGRLDGPGSPVGPHARADVVLVSNGPLTVYGFPLDSARVTAFYRDGRLDLANAVVGFAGGTATGRAGFDGLPQAGTLAFETHLLGADLARAVGAVDAFESANARAPAATDRTKAGFLRRTVGGRLDVSLTAQGRYREPYSFHGQGAVSVAGRNLGEIQLLGLLSELLSRTLLNFTSLRLDSARADFRLEGEKIAFANVRISGPGSVIDARGDYRLSSRTLDFKAKVFPLHQTKFVLTDALGALLSPLSSVLELKLTGPLAKPSWAFVFGPTNLLRSLKRPAEEPPGAQPPAKAPPVPPTAPDP